MIKNHIDNINTKGVDFFIGVLRKSLGDLDVRPPRQFRSNRVEVFEDETGHLISLQKSRKLSYIKVSVTVH